MAKQQAPKKPGRGVSGKPSDNKRGASSADPGTVHERLEKLDGRITEEMARCHQRYDADREALAAHHGKLTAREAALQQELAGLRPELEAFLHGETPGAGLTPDLQRKGRRYLEILHELDRVRTGKGLAFGATLPAGAQPLGRPLGEPLRSDDPDEEETEDGE